MDESELEQLLEVDMPTEEYYEEFGQWLKKTFPDASRFVLEHAECLEPLLDMAIVSGFSFGVEKAELYRIKIKYLGEIISRTTRVPTDEHRIAIINYPEPIPDIPALRRFMGVVNWVRPHEPAEFAAAAKDVTKYLSKSATWSKDPPYMGPDGCRGVKVLKILTARMIDLNAIDENAALSGERPLEQVADWNPIGWGCVLYQMSPDRSKMLVIGQWSGACTASQQAYHSTTGELYAQREGRRCGRRAVGRIAAICWCDNKTGVGQSMKSDVDVDVRNQRWLADIESDGSVLKNLSGRSAVIADGLSRALTTSPPSWPTGLGQSESFG